MNRSTKILIVILIIIGISLLIYFKTYAKEKNPIIEYEPINKVNEINEYNIVNIEDEKLATIYLNDYKYYLFNDVEKAYSKLDEEYKNNNFNTLEDFKLYINNIKYKDVQVKQYYISENKKTIKVETSDNRKYSFNIKEILNYTVSIEE